MVDGENLIDLSVRDETIPIILELRTGTINSPTDLQNLLVRSRAGNLVPLSSLTRITEEGVAAELDRTEQRRAIEIDASYDDGVALADAVGEITRLADEVLPQGMDMLLRGEAATLSETSRDLTLLYIFAFVIVLPWFWWPSSKA